MYYIINVIHDDIALSVTYLLFFQSIPADMQFCPNSIPPCYKSKDEVSVIIFYDMQNSHLNVTDVFHKIIVSH
jgi:hypothetical protein